MSAVPALSSNPGAYQKLYIDFDGDYTAKWGSYAPGSTPAYDSDGNPGSFSGGEVNNMREIWARVAEKYSPFNIDVTTVDPGSYTDGRAFRVVVGGNGGWAGSGGGIAWIGGFKNSMSNTGYVFSGNLAGGTPQYVGEAVAHEAGHGFGLNHQSSYSGTTKTASYNSGNGATAPIMGNSYTATRGLWWYGQNETSYSTYQDDMAVLGNSIGYRADDVGAFGSAAQLSLSGTAATASGVIERTTDWDYFSFSTSGGNVSFTANPASLGGMLDLQLSIVNSGGSTVANANTWSLGESINTYLPAGTYYVAVGSKGGYGDVGQYTITGSVGGGGSTWNPTPTPNPTPNPNPVVSTPAAPSGMNASAASSTQVSLSWSDNSSNETGFKIERLLDGYGTWSAVATVGAGVTAYVDGGLAAGTSYGYRVRATNASGDSGYSNVAWVSTLKTTTTITPTPNPTPVTPGSNNSGTKVTGTVIGTTGSWGGSASTRDKALDGNTGTFFDAADSVAWVGYDLGSPTVISSVRFMPRSGLGFRMVGGQFQGSNDASNWTTLHSVNSAPADGQYTTGAVNNSTAFRYVRYVSPAGGFGNVAEVEFYSAGSTNNPTTPTTNPGSNNSGSKVTGTPFGTAGSWGGSANTYDKAIDGNLGTFFDSSTATGAVIGYDLGSAKVISSVRFAPRSGVAARMVGGQFQGSNDNWNWTTLHTVNSAPADGQYTTGAVNNSTAFRYVRYLAPANSFGNVAEIEFYSTSGGTTTNPSTPSTGGTKLSGTVIGTAGSWNNSGSTIDKVFDGNASTFLDSASSQAWAGLDLGSAKYVSSVRFAPRSGAAWRMVGGQFQGSNDNWSWTTLHTITSAPADGQYTAVNLSNPGTYRYVRYLSPAGGYGNVAEVEFYSTAAAATDEPVIVVTTPIDSDEDTEAHLTPNFADPFFSDTLIEDHA